MRESIFSASIRSFFIALFGVAGLVLGVLLVLGLVGGLSSAVDGTPELNYTYTPEIKPNADGVRKIEAATAPVILKLNIHGVIGLDSLTRRSVAQQLIESRERAFDNNRVKAILLHIDSPGGTAVDSDGIYRELLAYKEQYKVPVYAYVDGFCASGGFYIACAADKVLASKASLIGSVGVLLPSIMNFSQLMEKVGVQSMTLYDGKGKDNLNPFRPWRKGEEDNIQDSINNFYQQFIAVVTAGRPHLDKDKLVNVYGANIYPADQAKEYGYIDESDANLNAALKELVEKIGIHDDYYQVVELDNKNWIAELFRTQLNLLSGKVTHHLELAPEFSPELSNKYLYLYRP